MTELSTGLEPEIGHGLDEASLHPAEVDLLCAYAEIAPPFPLRVPSLGATTAERRTVFGSARANLAARGLADHRGPRGVAADFVYLLRDGAGALDMIVTRRGQAVGALILARRDDALLISQDRARDNAQVRLRAMSVHDAVERMLRLVPDLNAAMAAPFSLPRDTIGRVHREIVGITATPGPDGRPRQIGADELDRLLSAHNLDEQLARRMVTNLQPVLGNGQAGVAVRRGYADEWTRSGEELRWLDTGRGRFRLAGMGDWMSVNPLTREELRGELRGLAQELW